MEGGSALADGREEGGSPREAYLHMLLGKVQASGTRTDAGSWAAALCPTQGGGKEGLVQAAIFSLCRCRLEASKIHFAHSKQLLPALSPAPCGGPDVACEALGFFCP